ncbi:fimbrial protein [Serratia fonticola]|uniref:fimbrial protein n=1 Tax=Serratia fonticola TaxID=47917 RepID=UPI0015C62322|nr:fimbrial protein [Serratia fonticola]MBC3378675.1 fimbrial protein [Serratia fonticola]NYA37875.1 fimbrial protein [Serratia fonticola]
MRFNNQLLLALSSSLLLLLAGTHPARAVSSTATVTLKATFTAPPCTIATPDQVFLGGMLPGSRSYLPFNISISCPSVTSTVLYAQIVQGVLTSGSTDRVDMSGPAGSMGTPAQLWLTTEGKTVTLDGSGATDSAKGFCAGTADRTCSLTPSVQVVADTPKGQTTATVRFSVMYP